MFVIRSLEAKGGAGGPRAPKVLEGGLSPPNLSIIIYLMI